MPIDCKGIEYEQYPLKNAENIAGRRYTRLVPQYRVFPINGDKRQTYWLCKCDCGNEVVATRTNLSRQHIFSCGCLVKEQRAALSIYSWR